MPQILRRITPPDGVETKVGDFVEYEVLLDDGSKSLLATRITEEKYQKRMKKRDKRILIDEFLSIYGEGVEVDVPKPVMTIKDDYPCAMCSGTNGYIKKLRINKETQRLEYYHNWWAGGWKDDDKYEKQVIKALKQVV